MSAVTLHFTPDAESKLRQRAGRVGLTLERYIEQLADDLDGSAEVLPKYLSDPQTTSEEFGRLLRDIATGPPLSVLPADFSRADIYNDHD
jgi:hypothetical protein